MFNAETFIDNWAAGYQWQEALASGEQSVAEIMQQLHNLNAEEGPELTEEEWGAVRRELQRHTR